jgi:hypothetical protein
MSILHDAAQIQGRDQLSIHSSQSNEQVTKVVGAIPAKASPLADARRRVNAATAEFDAAEALYREARANWLVEVENEAWELEKARKVAEIAEVLADDMIRPRLKTEVIAAIKNGHHLSGDDWSAAIQTSRIKTVARAHRFRARAILKALARGDRRRASRLALDYLD